MIGTLSLLGATGDLARRFVLPALGALEEAGALPSGFRVIGGARAALDDEGFRRLADDALPGHMLAFRPVDLADPLTLAAALGPTQDPFAIYLALSPDAFSTTIESIVQLGL